MESNTASTFEIINKNQTTTITNNNIRKGFSNLQMQDNTNTISISNTNNISINNNSNNTKHNTTRIQPNLNFDPIEDKNFAVNAHKGRTQQSGVEIKKSTKEANMNFEPIINNDLSVRVNRDKKNQFSIESSNNQNIIGTSSVTNKGSNVSNNIQISSSSVNYSNDVPEPSIPFSSKNSNVLNNRYEELVPSSNSNINSKSNQNNFNNDLNRNNLIKDTSGDSFDNAPGVSIPSDFNDNDYKALNSNTFFNKSDNNNNTLLQEKSNMLITNNSVDNKTNIPQSNNISNTNINISGNNNNTDVKEVSYKEIHEVNEKKSFKELFGSKDNEKNKIATNSSINSNSIYINNTVNSNKDDNNSSLTDKKVFFPDKDIQEDPTKGFKNNSIISKNGEKDSHNNAINAKIDSTNNISESENSRSLKGKQRAETNKDFKEAEISYNEPIIEANLKSSKNNVVNIQSKPEIITQEKSTKGEVKVNILDNKKLTYNNNYNNFNNNNDDNQFFDTSFSNKIDLNSKTNNTKQINIESNKEKAPIINNNQTNTNINTQTNNNNNNHIANPKISFTNQINIPNNSKNSNIQPTLDDMLNSKINQSNKNNHANNFLSKNSNIENNYLIDKDKELHTDKRFKQFEPNELNALKFKERNENFDFFNETKSSMSNVFEKIKKIDPNKKTEEELDPLALEFDNLMTQNKNNLKDYREMLLKMKQDKRTEREEDQKNKPVNEQDKQRFELRKRLADKLKNK